MALLRLNGALYGAAFLPASRSARDPRAASPCSRAGSLGTTEACPWGGAASIERCALWCSVPPRSEVSERWQSASPPERAGARPRGFALFAGRPLSATEACPRGGAATVARCALWWNPPPRSEVSERPPSASPPGRAGARPCASLCHGRVVAQSSAQPRRAGQRPRAPRLLSENSAAAIGGIAKRR
jgi:hypothetical protein